MKKTKIIKRLDELKKLIALGKEKGKLTYEQVNDILPMLIEAVRGLSEAEMAMKAAGADQL